MIRYKFIAKAAVRTEDRGRSPQIHALRRRMGQSHLVTWRNRRQDIIEWRLNLARRAAAALAPASPHKESQNG